MIMFNYSLREVGIDSTHISGRSVVVVVISSGMWPQILFIALIPTRRDSLLYLRFELSFLFSNWEMKILLIM